MAASPQLVYTTNYVTYVQIDVVLRFSVYACPFGTHRLALAGKGFGNGVVQWFGPSTVAVAIMCVELPSFLLYYCRHFFQIVGAKLPRCIAHLGCGRRLDHMYTRHHIRPCTFIPASTRDRGAFGRRAHRYSSWNRRGKPDLLRQNKGAAGRSSSSYYLRAICSTGAFTILARLYRDYRRSRIKHERETPSYPLNRCQKAAPLEAHTFAGTCRRECRRGRNIRHGERRGLRAYPDDIIQRCEPPVIPLRAREQMLLSGLN